MGGAPRMEKPLTVTRIGPGRYRVVSEGRQAIVYIAGPRESPTIFFEGNLYEVKAGESETTGARLQAQHLLEAPMPATVVQILVTTGQQVATGDTLLTLEAMKMQLPVRAPRDGVVRAIHCKVGELVQPGVQLVDVS